MVDICLGLNVLNKLSTTRVGSSSTNLQYNEAADDDAPVLVLHRLLQDIQHPLEVGHIDRALLHHEGPLWCVQEVVSQLVETHGAHVLEELADHTGHLHGAVWETGKNGNCYNIGS